MNRDRLEEFITANKEQLNTKTAPDELWGKINDELDSSKTTGSSNPWKKVSIILFLIVALLFVLIWIRSDSETEDESRTLQPLEFAELDDFKETEHYYLSSINVSYDKLKQFDVDATLEKDLSLLDENSQELLEEYKLAQGAYKEQVLRALIQNYKTKLQILENVLYSHETKNIELSEKAF